MKITIRDLLWLTVVAALGVSWWLDHRKLHPPRRRIELFPMPGFVLWEEVPNPESRVTNLPKQ